MTQDDQASTVLPCHLRERYQASRMVRRLEKRQKEMLLQIEDERRNTGQYKDQARRLKLFIVLCART